MLKIDEIGAVTPRCVVRPVRDDDYVDFIAGYEYCLPSQNRFDDGRIDMSEYTKEWFSTLIDRRAGEAESDYCYMLHVFSKETGRAIGYCDITTQFRDDLQYAKIGYTVFNNYWGKGYGTEIVKAIVKIGFEQLNFHRLEAHINLDNPASEAVVRKCGFCFEGVRRGFIFEDGHWVDHKVYYILNENWSPRAAT